MEIKGRNMNVDVPRIFGPDSWNIHSANKMNFVVGIYTKRRGLSLSNQRAHILGLSRQDFFVKKMFFLSLLFVVMQKIARPLLL